MDQLTHREHAFGETVTVAAIVPSAAAANNTIAEPDEQADDVVFSWLADGADLMRATRIWIQYGLVGFTIFCILVGAVEALFGR